MRMLGSDRRSRDRQQNSGAMPPQVQGGLSIRAADKCAFDALPAFAAAIELARNSGPSCYASRCGGVVYVFLSPVDVCQYL
jgi:hypothetical protein